MIQNITVRVPQTDNGWCGKVCNKPCENMSCLRLKNIYENKKDEIEKVLRLGPNSKEINAIMAKHDTNKDGEIDFKEFLDMMKEIK